MKERALSRSPLKLSEKMSGKLQADKQLTHSFLIDAQLVCHWASKALATTGVAAKGSQPLALVQAFRS